MPARAAILGLIFGSACRSEDPRTLDPTSPPASNDAVPVTNEPPRASPHAGSALADHLGGCVTVEGTAGGRKLGPELRVGDASLGVMLNARLETTWDELPAGTRVRVKGTVRERADLPVFVPKDGEPMKAGIPVPEGTDLEKARKRLVVEADTLEVVRPIEDVERDLSAKVGSSVALPGILWSRNGHWWFSHDGVDLHLEHREAIGDFGEMHGRALTLHGTLVRKPMPRIDQISVKSDRDLADAFVLTLDRATSPPPAEIAACDDAG